MVLGTFFLLTTRLKIIWESLIEYREKHVRVRTCFISRNVYNYMINKLVSL